MLETGDASLSSPFKITSRALHYNGCSHRVYIMGEFQGKNPKLIR